MVMTEKDAKNTECMVKRCCANAHQTYDANFAVYEYSLCAASACPAWRWYEDSMYFIEDRRHLRRHLRKGYCGLAGPIKYT